MSFSGFDFTLWKQGRHEEQAAAPSSKILKNVLHAESRRRGGLLLVSLLDLDVRVPGDRLHLILVRLQVVRFQQKLADFVGFPCLPKLLFINVCTGSHLILFILSLTIIALEDSFTETTKRSYKIFLLFGRQAG